MSSLWLDEALSPADDPAPALREAVSADVCIVGGGFTGLWTALALKEREPGCDVLLIERDVCGAGASGRNGGFALTWAAKFASLAKLFGEERALEAVMLSERAIGDIADFCQRHRIDAQVRRDGWLWTASNAAQIGSWRATTQVLERHGLHLFHEVDGDECRRRTGSARHLAGVFAPNAATVHPGHLVRGLRRVALSRGVRMHEHTPMTALERAARPTVRTPHGEVHARRVVLALNAWSAAVPELARACVVVGSDIVASEPCAELLRALGLHNGLAISDSRLFTHYYRTTADGRMVFGKGGGDFVFGRDMGRLFEGQSRYREVLERTLAWFHPELASVATPRTWSGPIDRSMSGLPMFGRLPGAPAVLYGLGYSGNGVGPTYVGGQVLASVCLERNDVWSRVPLVDMPIECFPPEPLRYVGARVIQSALRRKERAEDAGRRPARIDSALAAMMPGGLVPVKNSK